MADDRDRDSAPDVYAEGRTLGHTQCPQCGNPIVEERVTCPNCGYRYKEGDYDKTTEELVGDLPDEFRTEMSDEELERKGLQEEL
jgi:uncharacterized Zn finger protein (UPF0148 family)